MFVTLCINSEIVIFNENSLHIFSELITNHLVAPWILLPEVAASLVPTPSLAAPMCAALTTMLQGFRESLRIGDF
jgi:hypothetical protein